MAMPDGEREAVDMNPETKYCVERISRSRRCLAEAFRSLFAAGRNLTKRGTNGQQEE